MAAEFSQQFEDAAKAGNLEEVKKALKGGANINQQSSEYLNPKHTPLSVAIQEGHCAVVSFLLENGADVNTKDRFKSTPFDKALNYHGKLTPKLILRITMKVNVNVPEAEGPSPLFAAAAFHDLRVAKILLKRGAEVNHVEYRGAQNALSSTGPYGRTCLFFAGTPEMVDLLADKKVDLDIQNNDGNTALMYMIMENSDREVIKKILERGGNPNIVNTEQKCPLTLTTDLSLVRLLLSHKADPNFPQPDNSNKKKMTPLSYAAKRGILEVVKELVEHGARTSLQDSDASCPLHLACLEGHVEVAKYLLQKGAKKDLSTPVNSHGQLLIDAVSNEEIKLLLSSLSSSSPSSSPSPSFSIEELCGEYTLDFYDSRKGLMLNSDMTATQTDTSWRDYDYDMYHRWTGEWHYDNKNVTIRWNTYTTTYQAFNCEEEAPQQKDVKDEPDTYFANIVQSLPEETYHVCFFPINDGVIAEKHTFKKCKASKHSNAIKG